MRKNYTGYVPGIFSRSMNDVVITAKTAAKKIAEAYDVAGQLESSVYAVIRHNTSLANKYDRLHSETGKKVYIKLADYLDDRSIRLLNLLRISTTDKTKRIKSQQEFQKLFESSETLKAAYKTAFTAEFFPPDSPAEWNDRRYYKLVDIVDEADANIRHWILKDNSVYGDKVKRDKAFQGQGRQYWNRLVLAFDTLLNSMTLKHPHRSAILKDWLSLKRQYGRAYGASYNS